MSEIIKDGRRSGEKYGIIYRADEKAVLFPFELSEEEWKLLEEELKKFYPVEKDFIGLKVSSFKSKVYFVHRRYNFEKRISIEGLYHGCLIDELKEIVNTAISQTIIGRKLLSYWANECGEKEAEKRIKEITKARTLYL
jgi:hypothetical protein